MVPTLGPSLANATIASLVFLYLWARDRERYLLIWGVAWVLWVVRYVYGLVVVEVELEPASFVLPTLALARGALVLWGSYELLRRPMPRWWGLVLAADAVLILVEQATGTPLPLPGPPGLVHYLVFGLLLSWSGVLFTQATDLPRFEVRITGLALVIFGVMQVTFPMLGIFPGWYTDTVYVVVYALQAAIPLGVLLAYLRRSSSEVLKLHDALADAFAQALSEHLPICSHCKSIRDGQEWVGIERYVSGRTATTFSHGICPTCFASHYPDMGPYEETPAPPAPTGDR